MNKLFLNLAATFLLIGCPDERDPEPADGGADAAFDGSVATTDAGLDAGADTGAPSDRESLEQQTVAKLKQCGLYELEGDANQYSVEDTYDVCVAHCTLSASCDLMKQLVCAERFNSFTQCLVDCDDAPSDGFRCADGSRIPHAGLCDLLEDCPDGEDETSCGQFVCSDGEIIPTRSARCDWYEDCGDGSDELGCMLNCP